MMVKWSFVMQDDTRRQLRDYLQWKRACECYGLSKREFDRLLDDAPRRAAPPRTRRPGRV
jgi:hypothetical protein